MESTFSDEDIDVYFTIWLDQAIEIHSELALVYSGVSNGIINLEIKEKNFKITIDKNTCLPKLINSNS
jgi:hypothetical protein